MSKDLEKRFELRFPYRIREAAAAGAALVLRVLADPELVGDARDWPLPALLSITESKRKVLPEESKPYSESTVVTLRYEGGFVVRLAMGGWRSRFGFHWEAATARIRFFPGSGEHWGEEKKELVLDGTEAIREFLKFLKK